MLAASAAVAADYQAGLLPLFPVVTARAERHEVARVVGRAAMAQRCEWWIWRDAFRAKMLGLLRQCGSAHMRVASAVQAASCRARVVSVWSRLDQRRSLETLLVRLDPLLGDKLLRAVESDARAAE